MGTLEAVSYQPTRIFFQNDKKFHNFLSHFVDQKWYAFVSWEFKMKISPILKVPHAINHHDYKNPVNIRSICSAL